jgi:putative hemolysin
MYQRFTCTFFLIFLLLAPILGCSPRAEQPTEADTLTGLANPASVYCQGLGYDEETREGEMGQYGVCLFPDDSECDTWDFLAGRCGQQHSYCDQQGYQLEATEDGNIATCTFDDGSICSEFTYFKGDCEPGENMPDQPRGSDPLAGLANPASVYCQGLGYDEETREGEMGQYGACLFPDGSECDTWDFLAGRCGQQHSYCLKQGYQLEATEDGNIATCIFDDDSRCSEYQFFKGDCDPVENMP